MSKKCTVCGYEPKKEQEQKPSESVEDCPQCGGIETVQENDPPPDAGDEEHDE